MKSTLLMIACMTWIAAITASSRAAEPATQPAAYTGILRSGEMAIGGETTGWSLDADGKHLQVDVSKVMAAAEKLSGKRVTITGTVIEKEYVESGTKKVLIAEAIKAAEGK